MSTPTYYGQQPQQQQQMQGGGPFASNSPSHNHTAPLGAQPQRYPSYSAGPQAQSMPSPTAGQSYTGFGSPTSQQQKMMQAPSGSMHPSAYTLLPQQQRQPQRAVSGSQGPQAGPTAGGSSLSMQALQEMLGHFDAQTANQVLAQLQQQQQQREQQQSQQQQHQQRGALSPYAQATLSRETSQVSSASLGPSGRELIHDSPSPPPAQYTGAVYALRGGGVANGVVLQQSPPPPNESVLSVSQVQQLQAQISQWQDRRASDYGRGGDEAYGAISPQMVPSSLVSPSSRAQSRGSVHGDAPPGMMGRGPVSARASWGPGSSAGPTPMQSQLSAAAQEFSPTFGSSLPTSPASTLSGLSSPGSYSRLSSRHGSGAMTPGMQSATPTSHTRGIEHGLIVSTGSPVVPSSVRAPDPAVHEKQLELLGLPMQPHDPREIDAQIAREKPQHAAYIYNFRVQVCQAWLNGACPFDAYSCFQTHSRLPRRRKPILQHGRFNYIPTRCRFVIEERECPQGVHCRFSHVTEEVIYHASKFRTQLCSHPLDREGRCTGYGAHCAKAHGPEDLRQPVFESTDDGSAMRPAVADIWDYVCPPAQREEEKLYYMYVYKTRRCQGFPFDCSCDGLDYHREEERRRGPIIRYAPMACWPIADTRVLTNHGFLFYDEIVRIPQYKSSVLFACYEDGALVYRSAQAWIVKQRPDDGRLIDFTPNSERSSWGEEGASGQFATDSNHLSVRVTSEHTMWVKLGREQDGKSSVWDANFVQLSAEQVASGGVQQAIPVPDDKFLIGFQSAAPAGFSEGDWSRMRAVAEELGLAVSQLDTILELYGFWLSNGTLCYDSHSRAVEFMSTKPQDVLWIVQRLDLLGVAYQQYRSGCRSVICVPQWFDFFFSEYKHKYDAALKGVSRPCVVWTPQQAGISAEPFSDASAKVGIENADGFADDLAVTADDEEPRTKSVKWFAPWVYDCDRDQVRAVIRGLQAADGNCSDSAEARVIYTSSVQFRDSLSHLLLHAGFATHFTRKYPAGTTRGYSKLDALDATPISMAAYNALSGQEQELYQPITADQDSWAVRYSDPGEVHAEDACWPSLSRAEVSVAEKSSDAVWCVTVNSPSHLVVVQRARRDEDGIVRTASRPIVIGQCPNVKPYLNAEWSKPNVDCSGRFKPKIMRNGQLVPQESEEWDCEYAHTLLELMYHPQVYRTQRCDHFNEDDPNTWKCVWKRRCAHAHGRDEIRTKEEATAEWTQHLVQALPHASALPQSLNRLLSVGSAAVDTLQGSAAGSRRGSAGAISPIVQQQVSPSGQPRLVSSPVPPMQSLMGHPQRRSITGLTSSSPVPGRLASGPGASARVPHLSFPGAVPQATPDSSPHSLSGSHPGTPMTTAASTRVPLLLGAAPTAATSAGSTPMVPTPRQQIQQQQAQAAQAAGAKPSLGLGGSVGFFSGADTSLWAPSPTSNKAAATPSTSATASSIASASSPSSVSLSRASVDKFGLDAAFPQDPAASAWLMSTPEGETVARPQNAVATGSPAISAVPSVFSGLRSGALQLHEPPSSLLPNPAVAAGASVTESSAQLPPSSASPPESLLPSKMLQTLWENSQGPPKEAAAGIMQPSSQAAQAVVVPVAPVAAVPTAVPATLLMSSVEPLLRCGGRAYLDTSSSQAGAHYLTLPVSTPCCGVALCQACVGHFVDATKMKRQSAIEMLETHAESKQVAMSAEAASAETEVTSDSMVHAGAQKDASATVRTARATPIAPETVVGMCPSCSTIFTAQAERQLREAPVNRALQRVSELFISKQSEQQQQQQSPQAQTQAEMQSTTVSTSCSSAPASD